MRLTFGLIAVVVAAVACGGRSPGAGTYERVMDHDGRERAYVLHIPRVYDGRGELPLVLVFHGGGGNAENARNMSGMQAAADRHGFVAVFPDGSGRLRERLLTWNAENCCGYAREQQVDDVGFVRALVARLREELRIDERRIYATGMSNGAMLSYRLGCEAADLFAAIAPVAGAQNGDVCRPSEPISVVAYHGTADRSIRYEGGASAMALDGNPRQDRSVAESSGVFRLRDGCPATPVLEQSGSIIQERWEPCDAGTAVRVYTILGGGHAWPGGEPGFAGADVPTTELSATETMWSFFAAHPKPDRR